MTRAAAGAAPGRRYQPSCGRCWRLYDEPGPSPAGEIPLTVRAQMILGFAQSAAASNSGAICPRHLMLGVIAESRDWRQRGYDGPHPLEEAATTVGTDLTEIEFVLRH